MTNPWTIESCKRILFKMGIKHGVSPKLIYERLLSKEDKDDMLNGLIPLETLECFVVVWKEEGMRNYADGTGFVYSNVKVDQGEGKGSPAKVARIAKIPYRI